LQSSPSIFRAIIKEDEMGVTCSSNEKEEKCISVEYLKGRDHLEDLRHRWKDDTEVHLKEIGYVHVNWIHL
jgi:hypothetical protein